MREPGSRNLRGKEMLIPVRCFTCGKLIGDKWEKYVSLLKEGKTSKEALDELGIERYCCRRMFISHVDLTNEIVKVSSIKPFRVREEDIIKKEEI